MWGAYNGLVPEVEMPTAQQQCCVEAGEEDEKGVLLEES